MHIGRVVAVAGCLVSLASPAWAELRVSFRNGRATVIADGVPVHQVLREWARVGRTTIVGAEQLSGPPLTLRLDDVPERDALDILLRAAVGFVVTERAVETSDAARYDRVLILATGSSGAGGGSHGLATAAPSRFGLPSSGMMPSPGSAPVSALPVDAPDDAFGDAGANTNTGEVRPPETQFDYANPQQFLQRRLEQLQQQQMQQQQQQQGPTMFPGSPSPYSTSQPPPTSSSVPTAIGGTASRPGEIVKPQTPQAPILNPYGFPVGPAGQPMEPDRSKYTNPYQPQPTPPPPPPPTS